jgi:OOP family OmpA-OmpF porin
MQADITARAVAATGAVAPLHGPTVTVSGRDIRIGGLADSAAEREALLAALHEVEGRRVVVDDLRLIPVGAPYTTRFVKTADGALSGTGHIPSDSLRAALGAADAGAAGAVAGLELASGAPAGWADLARGGLAALAPLQDGQAEIADGRLRVTGTALGPAERDAVLAALPPGAEADLTLADDGLPADHVLRYDPANGAVLSGKLPVGVTPEAIAAALGVPTIVSEARPAVVGQAGDTALWARLKVWVPQLELLRVQTGPQVTEITIATPKGVDAAATAAAMSGDLGLPVRVAMTDVEAAESTERVNALTGRRERFSGGYWLVIPDFAVGRDTCQTETDAVLGSRTVKFLSGSDVLDADALAVLNDMASVIRECAVTGGLQAEIGGHTDASGTAESNRRLSQLRAAAVRAALIDRGVPREALVSRGYGADQPVADNATEEGRALNRRTTVIWSE